MLTNTTLMCYNHNPKGIIREFRKIIMSENKPIKNIIVKSLFIIGIFIVVIILTFAVIRVIPKVFSSFANVGDAIKSPFANESLEVEVNDTRISSGNPAYITWEYDPSENGVYELEYGCSEYLSVELGTTDGNKEIACDTIYHLNPTTQTISLLPTLDRENVLVDFPVYISYVNREGNVLVKDEIDFVVTKRNEGDLAGSGTIINTEVIDTGDTDTESNNRSTNNSNNSNSNTNNTNVTNTGTSAPVGYYGSPDLRLYNVRAIDDTTVVFSISNSGSNVSGPWYFNYVMPDGDVETSPMQNSLRPGEAIRFTLRLEDIPDGDVAIAVDPQNFIRESSEINNIAVIEIDGDGGRGGNYNYNRNDDADLEIDEFEVGYIDGNRFREDDEIDEDDDAAVRFVVVNTGGESTGRWRFTLDNIPYDDEDDFESRRQDSLRPGESVEIIVEFENPDEGDYDIELEVDSDDDVDEENERNNDESEELEVRD
jgi:hypothetical protein